MSGMSSASARTARSGGASRPSRPAPGSSTRPASCSSTAGSPARRSRRSRAGAGVSAETVYQAFGSKPALLAALVRARRAAGRRGADPRAGGASGGRGRARPAQQLRLFAADIVRRLERVGPLMAVVDAAAVQRAGDRRAPAGIDKARRAGLAEFVDALSARGPLAVDRAVAVDTVWALASPDLQQLLMRRRGWSRRRTRVARREPRPDSACPVRPRAGRGTAAGRRTVRPARSSAPSSTMICRASRWMSSAVTASIASSSSSGSASRFSSTSRRSPNISSPRGSSSCSTSRPFR